MKTPANMTAPATALCYEIHEVAEYINWIYFFHAWGFQPRFAAVAGLHDCDGCRTQWLNGFEEADRPKAAEAVRLYRDARRLLAGLDGHHAVRAVYRLMEAYADGDNLLLDGQRFPLLRQQTRQRPDAPFLCLSDFVRPLAQGIPDTVGAFATTVDAALEEAYADDDYRHLLVKTLCERLAEAAAEKLHLAVRRHVWAYAPDEQLSLRQLLDEDYQGIRPAVGYPSLPDLSVNFLLDGLLDFGRIGIRLTETGMMQPAASVSGLMFAHPAARYFAVGCIDEEQLADYAARRGFPVERMRPFLRSNLKS